MANRLSRLDAGMLTFLHIHTSDLSIDHLIALTQLKTLAVLVLQRVDYRYESAPVDSLVDAIRAWGRSIRESDSLRLLKVLVLSGYGCTGGYNSILQKVLLQSSSPCPALRLVGISGCSNDSQPGDWRKW